MKNVLRLHAHRQRLGARRFQLFALPQVSRERDDLTAVSLFQPLEDDRSVEAARIGQHHFLRAAFRHVCNSMSRREA
jgi:hypothetical protein